MKKNFEKLSDEEIIEIAREVLPLPSQVNIEEYVIPLLSDPKPLSMSDMMKPVSHVKVIQVFFRKTYVSGLAVGWHFDRLNRPGQ